MADPKEEITPEEITFDSDEWRAFIEWVWGTYSAKDARNIIGDIMRGVYQKPRISIESDEIYQFWVAQDSPSASEWKETQRFAELTPEEREIETAETLRTEAAEGKIYYVGNEKSQKHLESIGYELVYSDEFGTFPKKDWYFRKKKDAPKPEAEFPGINLETIDGRDVWVQRDPVTGKIISVQEAGKKEKTGWTEQEEAQFGLQEKEFEWRVSEAALSREEAAREARRQSEEARLGRQRLTQEDIQRELVARTGPADWIARWELIHGVMPKTQIGAMQQNQLALLEEANTLSGAERLWKEYQATKLSSEWQNLLAKTVGVPAAPSFYSTNTKDWTPEMFREAQVWEEALNEAQGQQSKTPPAPDWLSQFAPGQTTGKPITKERIVTPSGQQFARTPWSVREGLRGYTEFAGYEPYADILEKMAMMAPETPYVTGRWKPSTQRG